jgi:MFS family permease
MSADESPSLQAPLSPPASNINGETEDLENNSEIQALTGIPQDPTLRSRVFTPRVVLSLFMTMNFLTYYDRGVIAASLSSIKTNADIAGENVLSSAASGALVSVFMVGYMVTCPLFAYCEKFLMATRIVCVGLAMWIVAVFACGGSMSYYMLAFSRSLVGIGEAAYAGFVTTMIDDMAPTASRTSWMGMYFAMIPVGQAAGMSAGGIMSDKIILGISGWRVAFISEGFIMIPVIAAIALLPDHYNPKKHRPEDIAEREKKLRSFPPGTSTSGSSLGPTAAHVNPYEALRLLMANPVWVCTSFGYGMFTFVIGGLAVWAITFLQEGPLQMAHGTASVVFGVCTAFTGLVGTFLGGKILDWMGGSSGLEGVKKCHKFNTAQVILGLPCGLLALMTTDVYVFFALLFICEILMFNTSAPVNAATITIVAANIRTYAMSYSVFIIHLFGDFPSAIVAGALADYFSFGCADNQTVETCTGKYQPGNTTNVTVAPANNNTHDGCEWITGEVGEKSYCVNELQMRNSLLIVVSCLGLCALLWGLAWYFTIRMQRAQRVMKDG